MVKYLCFILLLTGCASTPPETITVYKTKEVKIPVPVKCPAPPEFSLPVLPLSQLNEHSSFEEIIKSYVTTVQILKNEVQLRNIALESYR